MSGSAARRRGRGAPASENSPRGGGFDGPASRGGGSTAPSTTGHSQVQSTGVVAPSSQDNSSSSPNSPSTPEGQGVDPARDVQRVPHYTDSMRNVDLPAALYGIGQPVSNILPLTLNCVKSSWTLLGSPPTGNDLMLLNFT